MDHYTAVLVLANAATLGAGGVLVILAHRAFRRTRTEALKSVAVGFLLIIGGAGVGAVGYLYSELAWGVLFQNVSTAGGVVVLLYSLYSTASEPIQLHTAR